MNKFKVGDIVYYRGKTKTWYGHMFKKDTPYSISIIYPSGMSVKTSPYSSILVDPDDFMSVDEYNSNNSDSFEKRKFKPGDIVYYNKDDGFLKKDVPFRLFKSIYGEGYDIFVNSDRRTLGIIFLENSFISENEYQNNKFNNSDIEIKLKIFTDTRSGKLKWFRPYKTHQDHYRTKIKLENPQNSYLRIDLMSVGNNKHSLTINYHRNSVKYKADQNSIFIKKYDHSKSISMLLKYVEKQVDEDEFKENK